MKKHGYVSLLACVLLIGLAATSAQAQSTMKVDVPFDFSIGNMSLQSGQYTVTQASPDANPEALLFRSADGNAQAVTLGIRMESIKAVEQPKLVFRKYGSHYFLSQVWLRAGDSGSEIRKGSLERELARRGTAPEVAAIVTGSN
jgi:hypothetical protein